MFAFQFTHPRRVRLTWRSFCGWPVGDFNSHTHAGCDKSAGNWSHCTMISIHTPVQGATMAARLSAAAPYHFNSRTYAGATKVQIIDLTPFQFTHPYRVRCTSALASKTFQFTPHAGGDDYLHFSGGFQFTPTQGATFGAEQ